MESFLTEQQQLEYNKVSQEHSRVQGMIKLFCLRFLGKIGEKHDLYSTVSHLFKFLMVTHDF
jgi:hypothetical protein